MIDYLGEEVKGIKKGARAPFLLSLDVYMIKVTSNFPKHCISSSSCTGCQIIEAVSRRRIKRFSHAMTNIYINGATHIMCPSMVNMMNTAECGMLGYSISSCLKLMTKRNEIGRAHV